MFAARRLVAGLLVSLRFRFEIAGEGACDDDDDEAADVLEAGVLTVAALVVLRLSSSSPSALSGESVVLFDLVRGALAVVLAVAVEMVVLVVVVARVTVLVALLRVVAAVDAVTLPLSEMVVSCDELAGAALLLFRVMAMMPATKVSDLRRAVRCA